MLGVPLKNFGDVSRELKYGVPQVDVVDALHGVGEAAGFEHEGELLPDALAADLLVELVVHAGLARGIYECVEYFEAVTR